MRFACTTLALLAALAIPVAARADNFTITSGSDVLTFTLPSNPTPSTSFPDEIFYLNNVPVTYDGVVTTDDLGFYTADNGGGFEDDFFGTPYGGQYFTGDASDPTFAPGQYFFYDEKEGEPTGTITITAGNAPEPSSLFLFGTGVLSMAGVARRRLTRA